MTKMEYKKALSSYPEALTASEVAEILRVCTKTVYKLIRQGEIPAVKVGRENRVSKSVLISYLRNKDKGSPNPKCVCSENSAECGIVHKDQKSLLNLMNYWTSGRSCGSVCGAGEVGGKERSA